MNYRDNNTQPQLVNEENDSDTHTPVSFPVHCQILNYEDEVKKKGRKRSIIPKKEQLYEGR